MDDWLKTVEELLPESELWRRAVGTALGRTISVVVLTLLGALSYLAWKPISGAIAYIGSLLGTRVAVPLWLLSMLILSAVAWGVFVAYYRNEKLEDEKEPHEEEFTEAMIGGIWWKWSWEDGEPTNFTPLCPNPECRMEVDFEDNFSLHSPRVPEPDYTKAECPKCDVRREWGRLKDGVISLVKREIERQVREDEWK
jgi:hypothetical protein